MRVSLLTAVAFSGLLLTAGCARRAVVVRPAPRVEVVPVPPSPRHVWIKGHYVKRGRSYVWIPGYYVVRRGRRY